MAPRTTSKDLPAPYVSLPSTAGGTVALNDLGPGRTILFVYPMTGQPGIELPEGWDTIPGARGCTSEACDFGDRHADLLDAGASRVFGVSARDIDYQREAATRLHLPYPLLSDVDLELAQRPGLPTFDAGSLRLFKRLTLIIRDGVIEHVFYPVFPPNEHASTGAGVAARASGRLTSPRAQLWSLSREQSSQKWRLVDACPRRTHPRASLTSVG